jgi:hypothetical protein
MPSARPIATDYPVSRWRLAAVAAALLTSACSAPVEVKPTVTIDKQAGRMQCVFPVKNFGRVEIRSALAEAAVVTHDSAATDLTISAKPTGGAVGYHSPDPNWKPTPAADWGMKFVASNLGSRLIVSSFNEISYIHDQYRFSDIRISAPPQLRVKLVNRQLSGDGGPDLHR